MNPEEQKIHKPQHIVSIYRELSEFTKNGELKHYPELDELFEKGFYVESFQQTYAGDAKIIITFSLKKFNLSTY